MFEIKRRRRSKKKPTTVASAVPSPVERIRHTRKILLSSPQVNITSCVNHARVFEFQTCARDRRTAIVTASRAGVVGIYVSTNTSLIHTILQDNPILRTRTWKPRACATGTLCLRERRLFMYVCVPCSVHERFCFCFLGPTFVFNFCLLFLFNIALTAFAPTARALLCCRQRERRLCMRVCPAYKIAGE